MNDSDPALAHIGANEFAADGVVARRDPRPERFDRDRPIPVNRRKAAISDVSKHMKRLTVPVHTLMHTAALVDLSRHPHFAWLHPLSELIVRAGDASNLTLDPDLDSYFVMDAVTLRMPALARMAHDAAQRSEERRVGKEC